MENSGLPVWPILESSQPQLSKSPMLQFLVRVYITPAALMACTKDVSLVATNCDRESKHQRVIYYSIWYHSCVKALFVNALQETTMCSHSTASWDTFIQICGSLYDSYHSEGRCVLTTGACSPDSSTSPKRTGVCTLLFHSVLPFAHCWHMSGKPWEIKQRKNIIHDYSKQ